MVEVSSSDSPADEAGNSNAQGRRTAEFGIGTIAEIVAETGRLLTALAALPPFRTVKVGLAEWVALNAIAATGTSTNKALSKSLGITPQRVAQISEALRESGMIEVVKSEVDSRKRIMEITGMGKRQLELINEELKVLLVDPYKEDSSFLLRTSKGLKRFNRILNPKAGKAATQGGGASDPSQPESLG